MNNFGNKEYCIISAEETLNMELLERYLYLLKIEGASSLTIWYKETVTDKINMISIKSNAENLSSCMEAINTLICKEGLIGLDYVDAFQYMRGGAGFAYFNEYAIQQGDNSQVVVDIENAKEFCKSAKCGVVLIDGWYTLGEAQEILELLECDDREIAFQVHVDESKKNGKVYIWTSENRNA